MRRSNLHLRANYHITSCCLHPAYAELRLISLDGLEFALKYTQDALATMFKASTEPAAGVMAVAEPRRLTRKDYTFNNPPFPPNCCLSLNFRKELAHSNSESLPTTRDIYSTSRRGRLDVVFARSQMQTMYHLQESPPRGHSLAVSPAMNAPWPQCTSIDTAVKACKYLGPGESTNLLKTADLFTFASSTGLPSTIMIQVLI